MTDPETPLPAIAPQTPDGLADVNADLTLRQVIDKVRVTNPDYLEPMHREAAM